MTYIGDANDCATIMQDACIFFKSYFAATDADEAASVKSYFGPDPTAPKGFKFPPYWILRRVLFGVDPGP